MYPRYRNGRGDFHFLLPSVKIDRNNDRNQDRKPIIDIQQLVQNLYFIREVSGIGRNKILSNTFCTAK